MTSASPSYTSNIPKILLMNFHWMFLVIMPVIVPFLQLHGLDMQQVYLLQSVFAIGVFVLEVPSGYIADLFGRKKTLITGALFSGVAFTILAFSNTITGFIIFELCVAVAASLMSGTDVALIYDSLAVEKKSTISESAVLGKKIFFAQIGETVAALVGGAAAAYSVLLPAKINAVTAWIPLLIALTLTEPPRTKLDTRRHLENFRHIYRALFRHSRLLTLIILNFIAFSAATLLAVWAFQGYWKTLGVPVSYFGYLWAGFNLTVALSGRVADSLKHKVGIGVMLLLISLLPMVGYGGMAWLGTVPGIIAGAAFQISRGFNQVILRDALNLRVSGEMRATANSIASLGVRLSFAIVGPLMGTLIDSRGYPHTFAVFAGVYLLLFLGLALPLIREFRKG